MKYLTNFDTSTPQPTLSSFLSPRKTSAHPYHHLIKDPKNEEKDKKIVEENLTRLKTVERRGSKPKILSNPATRDDVESLGKWLDSMISALANEKNLSLQGLFENLQLVYLGCFQELIRQVSIECFERGQLIQKIWNAYINLFERAIIEQSKGLSALEIDYLRENARLHRMYQKELEKIKSAFTIMTQEKKGLELEVSKLSENFKYAKKKNLQLEKDTQFFKTNYENMRVEYNLISEDNIALKSLIEKNLQTEKRNEDVEYVLRRLPKREKKIGTLIYDRKAKKPSKEEEEVHEDVIEDPEDEKDISLYIEEKAVDTMDLIFNEEKAVDTNDLMTNSLEKRRSIVETFETELEPQLDAKLEPKLEKMSESMKISSDNMIGLQREFPRLSGLMVLDTTPDDLREEIMKILKVIANIQEEMQDLKISMQEKENEVERLMERQGKKEQEFAILSEEVILSIFLIGKRKIF